MSDQPTGYIKGELRPQTNVEKAKRFWRRHQTTILTGAVVYLVINQRNIAKDLNLVGKATIKVIDAGDKTLDAIDKLNLYADELYVRTDILDGRTVEHAGAINAQANVIRELKKADSNIMDQVFGPKK